ncbi:hypothetical protein [Fibrobacter sp. UWH9]|uniref:hypothetical protein n=2 Tax=unclassified Fibrobacter TaxID=2634177 RepID=UPI0011148AD9|nr:hypothetical protein [Fibrobacter sp. UWH9]
MRLQSSREGQENYKLLFRFANSFLFSFFKSCMKRTLYLILILTFLLTGCSTVMRPPSAVAFMESYDKNTVTANANISLYGGDLNRGGKTDNDIDDVRHQEWVFDYAASIFKNFSFFSIGGGVQTFTQFLQTGFISPYLGITGWCSLIPSSAGGMIIQQIPIGDNIKIGFTEHFSRNGREEYKIEFGAIPEKMPSPKFYREAGAGFYVSIIKRFALEFRYGRDLDNEQNRFALTVDIFANLNEKNDGNE